MPAAATRIARPSNSSRLRPTASTTPAQSTPGISGSTGAARRLLAGAQAHVEHAVDGSGMNADADLARARRRIGQILVSQHIGRAELRWMTIAFMRKL